MGISEAEWKDRIENRSDITRILTHLTRPDKSIDISKLDFAEINLKAVDNLIKILKDEVINGSDNTGFINGKTKAVCFQDAPLYGLIQNIEYELSRRITNPQEPLRYCGVGLSFMKQFIYKKQGRPVIYDNRDTAKHYLKPSEYWRIVSYDLSAKDNYIDWTHEREWRVPGSLKFKSTNAHVILYNAQCYKYFLNHCPKNILENIGGITTLRTLTF
ncbi:hypothetical protein [Cytobacillus firmus]|uniref:DUF2971 domain-containing protein n=1 Tax=Cytobacillus firmus DS1 TaxID=1307436 RepID=W7LKS8_CYTFI|nr:hypothetical protein [Cytobacillus firmus]EWG12729.1 hypothetical protein PBF_04300 [Cytobacillus firmus DS1]